MMDDELRRELAQRRAAMQLAPVILAAAHAYGVSLWDSDLDNPKVRRTAEKAAGLKERSDTTWLYVKQTLGVVDAD
jgi:hypothetical protein